MFVDNEFTISVVPLLHNAKAISKILCYSNLSRELTFYEVIMLHFFEWIARSGYPHNRKKIRRGKLNRSRKTSRIALSGAQLS